jgi:hypothetical protein
MNNEEVTIEQLAIMMQKGFAETASKEDVKALRLELDELKDRVDYGFTSVNDKLDKLKSSLGEPVIHREEYDDLVGRVKYVETKLGVESGK